MSLPTCPAALLLVDVVNPLDFEGGPALLPAARAAVERIARLKRHVRRAGIPAIYVNDNFGCWHLSFRDLTEHIRKSDTPGAGLVEIVEPDSAVDHFILKPMHSGFFNTSLDVLLHRLEARRLIVTGIAADICVLHTAGDAHMRGYRLTVPEDCVVSEREEDRLAALRHMAHVLDADVSRSTDLDIDRLVRSAA